MFHCMIYIPKPLTHLGSLDKCKRKNLECKSMTKMIMDRVMLGPGVINEISKENK